MQRAALASVGSSSKQNCNLLHHHFTKVIQVQYTALGLIYQLLFVQFMCLTPVRESCGFHTIYLNDFEDPVTLLNS